jgi:predicted RNA-binding Zn ribbon-like protein
MGDWMMTRDNPLAGLNVIGGRVCLDFVNTVDTHDTYVDEKLKAYPDLVWWALRIDLLDEFAAARAGEHAEGADVGVLNGALSRTLGHLRVEQGDDGFGWGWEEGVDLERVLWPVVRDAAELLVGGELRRVGRCCGDSCDWLYLDTSRNRSRRWCDMQSCGNRAKARRHYHRARGGSADG